MAKHKALILEDVHTSVSFEAADEAARLALVLTSADINKLVKQLDTNDFYYILNNVGPTFKLMTAEPGIAVGDVLNDISDVNAPAPTDQQVLTWDNGTSKWVPATVAASSGGGSATGGDLFHPLDLEEKGIFVQPNNNSFLDSFNYDKQATLTDSSLIVSAWRMDNGILSGAKYEASKLCTIDKNAATGQIQYTLQALAPKSGQSLPFTGASQNIIFNGDVTSFFENGKKVMIAKKLEQFGGLNGTTTSHVFLLNGGSAGGTTLDRVARLLVGAVPSYNSGNDETTVTITNPNTDDLAFDVLTADLNEELRFIPFDVQMEVSADGGINFIELEVKDAQGIDVIRLQGESVAQQIGAIDANAMKIDFDMSDNGQYGVLRILRDTSGTQDWDFYGSVDSGKTWTLMGTRTANSTAFDAEVGGNFKETHARQILVADNGKFIAGWTRNNDSGIRAQYNVYGILTGGLTITDSPDSGLGSALPRAGAAHSSVTGGDSSLLIIVGDRTDLSYYAWTGYSANGNTRQAQFLFTGAVPVQQGVTQSFGSLPPILAAPYNGIITGTGASHRHHLIGQMTGGTKMMTFYKGDVAMKSNLQISPAANGIKILDAQSDGGEKIYIFGRYDLAGNHSLFIVDNAATGTPSNLGAENVVIPAATGITRDTQNGFFAADEQSSMKTMGRRMIVNPADSNHIAIVSQFNPIVDRATLIVIKDTTNMPGIADAQYTENADAAYRNSASDEQRGQTVLISNGQRIRSVLFKPRQVGEIGPGYSVWLEIYATAAGVPTGPVLATSTNSIDPSKVAANASGERVYWNFDDPATENMTAGLYAIVIRSDFPIDASNYLTFKFNTNPAGYADGTIVTYNGATWSTITVDYTFEVNPEWITFIGHEGGLYTSSNSGDYFREVETQISLIDANSANIVWRRAFDGNNSAPTYTMHGQSYKRVYTFDSGQGTLSDIQVLGHNQTGGSPDFDESNVFMLAFGSQACADRDVKTGLDNADTAFNFHERSGYGAVRSSGGLTGTNPDVLFDAGVMMSFNGSTHYHKWTQERATNWSSAWDFVIEVEVRFDSLAATPYIMHRGTAGANDWSFGVEPDGRLRFRTTVAASQKQTMSTAGDITTGVVWKLRMVYDSSTRTANLYKSTDGITYTLLSLTVNETHNVYESTTNGELTIGRRDDAASNFFDGDFGYAKINKNRYGVMDLSQNTTAKGPFAYAGFKDQSGYAAIELKGNQIYGKRPSGENHLTANNNVFMTPMMISSEANDLAVVDSYDQLLEYEGAIPNAGKELRLRITKGRKSEDDQSTMQGLNVIYTGD